MTINIGFARKVDLWAGVPLCFLLSVFHALSWTIFRKHPRVSSPNKILFIKLSELGAIILGDPLVCQVREQYPSAQLFFLTFEMNRDVFPLLGGGIRPENVLCIRTERAFFLRDILAAIRRLRRERIDVVFDLEFFSRCSAALSYLSGARTRVGFYRYGFEGLYRGNFLTHQVLYNPLSHIARTYLSMAQVIARPQKTTPEMERVRDTGDMVWPVCSPDPRLRERMTERLRGKQITAGERLFLLHPGDGVLPLRDWPLEHFADLARRILEDNRNRVLLVGTAGASVTCESLRKSVDHPGCVDLSGTTSLEELMALMSLSTALISHDCGMAHLAMLSPIKVFVIFGPESPQVFAPLGDRVRVIDAKWPCSPCLSVLNHRNSFCRDNRCLQAVTPEDVYQIVQRDTAA